MPDQKAYREMVSRHNKNVERTINRLARDLRLFNEGDINIAESKCRAKETADWLIKRT